MQGDVESDDEQTALRTRSDPHVPFIANPDLRLNALNEHRDIGSKSIDAISGSAEHAGKIGAPVIANLPEAVECQTRFDNAVEQPRPCSSLHLQRVAAGDVDAALAEIQVVARKRGEKGGPISVGEDRAARGELVRDVTRTEPAASRQRRSASRNIEAVGANEIHLIAAPTHARGLNVDVAQNRSTLASGRS